MQGAQNQYTPQSTNMQAQAPTNFQGSNPSIQTQIKPNTQQPMGVTGQNPNVQSQIKPITQQPMGVTGQNQQTQNMNFQQNQMQNPNQAQTSYAQQQQYQNLPPNQAQTSYAQQQQYQNLPPQQANNTNLPQANIQPQNQNLNLQQKNTNTPGQNQQSVQITPENKAQPANLPNNQPMQGQNLSNIGQATKTPQQINTQQQTPAADPNKPATNQQGPLSNISQAGQNPNLKGLSQAQDQFGLDTQTFNDVKEVFKHFEQGGRIHKNKLNLAFRALGKILVEEEFEGLLKVITDTIDFNAFINYYKQLQEINLNDIKQIFELLDEGRSGKVLFETLKSILKTQGDVLTDQEIEEVLKEYTDMNNTVDYKRMIEKFFQRA